MYKILIADDERWIRKGIMRMIDREKNQISDIYEAENVEEALSLFRREKPEIILSDVCFPAENGCDLGDQIYQMDPQVKIVMISAYDDFDNARRAIRFRAVDYLLKPVNREQLNLVIGQCVKQLKDKKESKIRESIPEELFLSSGDTTTSQMIEKQMEQIKSQVKKHYTLSGMAAESHISEAYFSSLFKKIAGKSPMSYVAHVKVEKAQELMLTTDYKLVQIARAVGYEDYRYFTKVFKKIAGMTPLEYKAQLTKEMDNEEH